MSPTFEKKAVTIFVNIVIYTQFTDQELYDQSFFLDKTVCESIVGLLQAYNAVQSAVCLKVLRDCKIADSNLRVLKNYSM